MKLNRRHFLKVSGALSVASLASSSALSSSNESAVSSADTYGCLVDTTLCVGCRKCEQACNERHHLAKPDVSFEEMTVLENERRMDETSYTVVNKYYPENIGSLTWRTHPVFVKFQCMHCNDPSCVSACIVGALSKEANGAVTYDVDKCIGCRYCMVACPFQVPAYEYSEPLTPHVRKCNFCFDTLKVNGLPACAQVCPREAIVFGKKKDVLDLARWKMKRHPGKYTDHIYGEHEVGGTSWMYIASEPFKTIGFPELDSKAPPRLTEAIQHGLFQYFAAPIGLFVTMGGAMHFSKFFRDQKKEETNESGDRS
ncbi:MAG: 4Fe-4S dicluster domain-containing protein [Deltaproteobacteria bacterium]|jgi:formate dehydrogenase iron-sulfur subunit|nr:4Fe-4S dicluster domain-containing protein [Deltaproteobacteria bacterium]